MSKLKFKPGDKVIFCTEEGEKWHDICPASYPPVGTIGTVIDAHPKVQYDGCNIFVQWPKGSTSIDGQWYCNEDFLDLVEDEKPLDIHGGFTMAAKPTLEDFQIREETPDELWPRTNPLLDISEAKDVILPLSEYSTRVDVLRKNRVQVAFYKYGPARKNFGGGRVDAFKTAELCMDAFRKDHNTEHLLDAMNYLMFRFMYPYPGEEFKPTDSDGSVGTVGTPINMEEN